jgi:hypothetical protein
MSASYPVSTLAEMAEIPEEALPRFLAELPAILTTMRQLKAAAPDLAEQAKANAPRWIRWAITADTTRRAIAASKQMTWVDDDKGLATVSLAISKDGEPILTRVEKMLP